MTNTIIVTDSTTTTEVIAGTPGIVLVDFSAAWCAPCRMLTPMLEQLACEIDDLTVVQVDVDASPSLASAHQVMSFPTLIFFVDGHLVRRLVGAHGVGSLREELHRVRSATSVESGRPPVR